MFFTTVYKILHNWDLLILIEIMEFVLNMKLLFVRIDKPSISIHTW